MTTETSKTCRICGGWARTLPDSGAHNLCIELQKRGLPTPSLGDRCDRCDGSGHLGRKGAGAMLGFDLGPAKISQAIAATFPTCPACRGSGIVKGGLS